MSARHERVLLRVPLVAALASLAALAASAAAGCVATEAPGDDIPCGRASISVGANVPIEPVAADFKLTGFVASPELVAIRRVLVEGIVVKRLGFNHSLWEVDVPLAVVRQRAEEQAGAELTEVTPADLQIVAEHACGLQQGTARVEVEPGITTLTSLAVALAPATERADYLPIDGSVPATVTVTTPGNPGSGTPVELEILGGGRLLATRVVLEPLAGGGGAASTLAFASDEGTLRVEARLEGLRASGSIEAFGPPRILPAGATLLAGQEIVVSVETRGALRECEASGSPSLLASAGGEDLSQVPITSFADPHQAMVRITAGEGSAGDRLSLTCRDVHSQTVRAVFEHGGGGSSPPEGPP